MHITINDRRIDKVTTLGILMIPFLLGLFAGAATF